jgi:hypothetical protein
LEGRGLGFFAWLANSSAIHYFYADIEFASSSPMSCNNAEKVKTPIPRNPRGIGHPEVQNRLKAFATRPAGILYAFTALASIIRRLAFVRAFTHPRNLKAKFYVS